MPAWAAQDAIRNTATELSLILTDPSSAHRASLARTYLSMLCRSVLVRRGWMGEPAVQTALRWRVRHAGCAALFGLLKEVFIRNIYHFLSDKPDPFIIDGGSNIGMSVPYFKQLYPDAKVPASEPEGRAYRALRDNLRDNKLSRVEVIQLDVEGAEGEVVLELWESGKQCRIRRMAIEYHTLKQPGVNNLAGLLSCFESSGFEYAITGPDVKRDFHRGGRLMIYAMRRDPESTPLR